MRLLIVQIDAAINVGNRLAYNHSPAFVFAFASRPLFVSVFLLLLVVLCARGSGGPAFDAKGNVVGIAFLKQVMSGADNIGYCSSRCSKLPLSLHPFRVPSLFPSRSSSISGQWGTQMYSGYSGVLWVFGGVLRDAFGPRRCSATLEVLVPT